MEQPIRDIPGFYYNHEKKKYFKIQPNSAGSSAYSVQDVKRRKTRDDNVKREEFAIARQKNLVKRSRIITNPLPGGLLLREQSQKQGRNHLATAEILASGLKPKWSIPIPQTSIDQSLIIALDPRRDLGPSRVDLRATFDGHIYTSHLDVAAPVPRHGQEADIATDLLPSRPSWRTVIYDMQGPSTSLNLHLATQTLAMTWLSGNSQTGIAVSPMNISNDLDTDRPFIFTGPGTSRGSDVDVQSSAAAHPDSSLLFAFGTSQGILTMDKRDFSATWLSPKPSSETSATPYPKDVFAMEFLSDNPFILLSGGRNGILNITDLRRPRFESDADVILHPSCITHIKQLDMHRLIVAGLNSSLCQYDLRYRKSKMAQKSPLPKASRTSHNSTSTASILQYSEYQNSASIQIGFDVDTVSGIVAAAQEPDEYHPIVQLFSLHGGHTLSSPEVHRRFADIEVVKSLKFAEDFENRPKSLYVSYNGIHQFSWRQ